MSDILNRIKKNYKHLKKWLSKENIQAFRIYDKDIPEFPFIIDIYGKHAVIYYIASAIDGESKIAHQINLISDSLNQIFEINSEAIFVKIRGKMKGNDQYEKVSRIEEKTIVKERFAQYTINLSNYLDVGLFLDHRPIRNYFYQNTKDKSLLNLFCYTGSISVSAALGGAHTTSVDMNPNYILWTQDNFLLNSLELKKHKFIQADCIEYLNNGGEENFDLIFLDPPTFSNSKKMKSSFEVEKDQNFLVERAMTFLKPDGILYFSNNKRNFKISSQITNDYLVKDITSKTIPRDFRDKKIHSCFEIRK